MNRYKKYFHFPNKWEYLTVSIIFFAGVLLHFGPLLLLASFTAGFLAFRRTFSNDIGAILAPIPILLITVILGSVFDLINVPVFGSRSALPVYFLSTLAILFIPKTENKLTDDLPLGIDSYKSAWRVLPFLPSVLLVTLGLYHRLNLDLAPRWLISTDSLQHAWFIQNLREIGTLDVTWEAYPQLLNILFAWTANASNQSTAIQMDIAEIASFALFGVAYLALATAVLSLRTGHRVQLPVKLNVAASLTAVLAVTFSTKLSVFFWPLAAAPTAFSIAIITAGFALSISVKENPWRWLLGSTVVQSPLIGNLWTAALLYVGCVAATSLIVLMSQSSKDRRWGLSAVGAHILALLLTVPIVISIYLNLGTEHANTFGTAILPPRNFGVLLGCGALYPFIAKQKETIRTLTPILPAGILFVAGLLFLSGDPTNFFQYYPAKALWMALATTAGVSFVTIARTAMIGWNFAKPLRDRSALIGTVLPIAVVLLYVIPYHGPFFSSHMLTRGTMFQRFSFSPGPIDRPGRQMGYETWDMVLQFYAQYGDERTILPVASGNSPVTDIVSAHVASKILRLQTGQDTTSGLPSEICHEVEHLGGKENVIVVTSLPADLLKEISTSLGCPDITIINNGIELDENVIEEGRMIFESATGIELQE